VTRGLLRYIAQDIEGDCSLAHFARGDPKVLAARFEDILECNSIFKKNLLKRRARFLELDLYFRECVAVNGTSFD
jgi:hypothetical protein